MSAASTPSKRGVVGVHIENQTLDLVVPRLMEDISGRYTSNINLVDFVVSVWGIDRGLTDSLLEHSWKIPSLVLDKYRSATLEMDLYEQFANIANDLVKDATQFASTFTPQSPTPDGIHFWHARGTKPLESVLTTRKPDMLIVAAKHKDVQPRWTLVRHVLEFKRHGKNPQVDVCMNKIAPNSDPGPFRTLGTRRGSGSRGRKYATRSKLTPLESSNIESYDSEQNGMKRKHQGSNNERAAKRPRKQERMEKQHAQLAIYSLECLDASSRHYTSGIWIDQFDISLWYYDRASVIRTEIFNFKENPGRLALVLYALSTCTDQCAGFDPYLIAGDYQPPERPSRIRKREKHNPNLWQEVNGFEYKFPASAKYPRRGRYRILETLFAYRGLLGRGTMVYRVLPLLDTHTFGVRPPLLDESNAEAGEARSEEALKIGWPSTKRHLEGYILECLRRRLPEQWHEHLPDVTFAATMSGKDLQLPRFKLVKDLPEDRQLHILGMKLYHKLWEAGSVDEFMEIFVDCVECHHHAYHEGRVLHRDLSENNLMFEPLKDGKKKGILNDWDMSSFVDDNNEIPLSHATHRTGTVPFMARDLLTKSPPAHLYRHDLESFFYILVWVSVHYDFSQNVRDKSRALQKKWDREDLDDVRYAKIAFISDFFHKQEIFNIVPPKCEALRPWLEALWILFHEANDAQGKNWQDPNWDTNTSGGQLTFTTFMAALGRRPRS
ncbi:hypothetical protein H0H92_016026 [Tricholoma furcatifolium]|nr:hypothetical protein H0H92_016026 [Tricholoma furcatifolium]